MISFDTPAHRFDLRAAAVVLRDNAVLLHRLEGDSFWSLPGGRVEPGETAAHALVRELHEELAEPATCERLLWVIENFFSHRDKQHHEVGLYFITRLLPASRLFTEPGPFIGREGHRLLEFAWFERSLLGKLDIRPSFVPGALASHELQFQHVVHRDAAAL